MHDSGLDYLVNCSMLFTERPLLERPAAARAAGFDAIEFWWPWPEQPVPAEAEVDAFVRAIRDAGVQLVGLNFFAGDLAGADAGVLSIPDRSPQFRDNLGRAADTAARIGATVLVEPVSGPKPYPLRTADDAVAVVEAVRAAGHENVGFLCDLFHLANNGDDIDAAIARHARVRSLPARRPAPARRGIRRRLHAARGGRHAGAGAHRGRHAAATDRRTPGRSTAR
jgi:hydroxypyruvate isomerase